MSRRVQLRRTRGWVQPPNCLRVDRLTPWGNPFRVAMILPGYDAERRAALAGRPVKFSAWKNVKPEDRCVELFQRWVRGHAVRYEAWLDFRLPAVLELSATLHERRRTILAALPRLYRHLDAGGCLGCWCKPAGPCHAEILLAFWPERYGDRACGRQAEGRAG